MLNKYDLVRLHRIAYSLGKRFSSVETTEDKKFFKTMFENQENLLLDQFDYRWYYTSNDWFPSYEDVRENQILSCDNSVTLNCFIVLKEHKIPLPCKMNIKPDNTLTVFNGTRATYDIKNITAYYIIPRYIKKN